MIAAILPPVIIALHFAGFFKTVRTFHIRNELARRERRPAPGVHGSFCGGREASVDLSYYSCDDLSRRPLNRTYYGQCDCGTQVMVAFLWEFIPLGIALRRAWNLLVGYCNPDITKVGKPKTERRIEELEQEIAQLAREQGAP